MVVTGPASSAVDRRTWTRSEHQHTWLVLLHSVAYTCRHTCQACTRQIKTVPTVKQDATVRHWVCWVHLVAGPVPEAHTTACVACFVAQSEGTWADTAHPPCGRTVRAPVVYLSLPRNLRHSATHASHVAGEVVSPAGPVPSSTSARRVTRSGCRPQAAAYWMTGCRWVLRNRPARSCHTAPVAPSSSCSASTKQHSRSKSSPVAQHANLTPATRSCTRLSRRRSRPT